MWIGIDLEPLLWLCSPLFGVYTYLDADIDTISTHTNEELVIFYYRTIDIQKDIDISNYIVSPNTPIEIYLELIMYRLAISTLLTDKQASFTFFLQPVAIISSTRPTQSLKLLNLLKTAMYQSSWIQLFILHILNILPRVQLLRESNMNQYHISIIYIYCYPVHNLAFVSHSHFHLCTSLSTSDVSQWIFVHKYSLADITGWKWSTKVKMWVTDKCQIMDRITIDVYDTNMVLVHIGFP